jgi:RecB family exonuclease
MDHLSTITGKLSFSARERWAACPYSVKLSADLPPEPSGPYAEEGTAAHLVAEWYVRQHFKIPYADGTHVPHIECPDVKVPEGLGITDPAAWQEQLRQHGKAYRDFVIELAAGDPNVTVEVERKVDIRSIHPQLRGILDLRMFSPRTGQLHVVDYKYGVQPVEVGTYARTNPQLAAYTVATLENIALPTMPGTTVSIFQPRALFGDAARQLPGLDASWLQTERGRLIEEVRAVANATEADVRPGDYCKYCPARSRCPVIVGALRQGANAAAGIFDVRMLSDDDAVRLWSVKAGVTAVMDDLNERVRALARSGHKSLKVVNVSGSTTWTSDRETVLTLVALGKIEALKPPSVADAAKLLTTTVLSALTTTGPSHARIQLAEKIGPDRVLALFPPVKPLDK